MGSCKENIGTYLGKSLLFYECCSVLFWFLPSYQSSPSFHLSLVPLSTIHLSSSLVLPKVASESTLEVFLLEELLCSSHKNKTKNENAIHWLRSSSHRHKTWRLWVSVRQNRSFVCLVSIWLLIANRRFIESHNLSCGIGSFLEKVFVKSTTDVINKF